MGLFSGNSMASAMRKAEKAVQPVAGGVEHGGGGDSAYGAHFAGMRVPDETQANIRVFDFDPGRRTFTLNVAQAGGEIEAQKMAEGLGLQIVSLGNKESKFRVPGDLNFDEIQKIAKRAVKVGYKW